jgi:hypothetical protein
MAVTLPKPVVIPAKPQTTYDELWVSSLTIASPVNGQGIVVDFDYIATRTADPATGAKEADPNGGNKISFGLNWADMTKDELTLMYGLVTMLRSRLQ